MFDALSIDKYVLCRFNCTLHLSQTNVVGRGSSKTSWASTVPPISSLRIAGGLPVITCETGSGGVRNSQGLRMHWQNTVCPHSLQAIAESTFHVVVGCFCGFTCKL